MPSLDPKVAVHHLAIKKGVRPVKQAQWRFRPDLIPLIEIEVNKLIEARDLNNACPKDGFPLSMTELMIDATTGHEVLSFIDVSSRYNQIRLAPKDEELTAFRTPKSIYCYKVMPFGLKNAGATYQRAMQSIFDDMLHKNIECYVNDLVVKSKKRSNHLEDLRQVFDRLRRYQLKMNPLKCAFGVTSGKFLGFVVRHRSIEIDQAKIDAILRMPEPRDIHELKSFQGRLAYLRRFISNLAGRCQPFSCLMKKDVSFQWAEACSNAFNSIKSYLMKAPVLAALIHGKPLLLYITAQERSVGALLAQENNEGKEKLKHYFQAHSVRLISRANPIKYVTSRPVLSDRLVRWYLQLQQFEIIYVPQKAVKGQVLADFLADHPIPAEWELSDDLPDKDVLLVEIRPPWKMYFDGAAHRHRVGLGIVFVTPDGGIMLYSFTLNQHCSNNVAEYQTLILGLEIAVDMEQLDIQIYGNSQLVVNQLLESYKVKKSELIPYHKDATRLMRRLGGASIKHVPRRKNKQADALAALASSLTMPNHEIQVRVCQKWVVLSLIDDEDIEGSNAHVVSTYEIDKEDWRQPLVNYLKYQKLPEEQRRRTDIRRRAPRFILYKDTLYRKSFEGVLLHCLSEDEAYRAMHEAHSGICGTHQSGPKLHFRIKRMGYYWPTMVKDCIEYAQRCQPCQFHTNYIHQPPEPLHPTVAS
ncbi:uncharacterized protein LOC113774008 [Coffea eugenioides]|uniref:uncharacterized protein LOC113774008 n=1 Tax=Coffea eugenioides TaxID=49369 RepID=UPI000F604DEE|nr:uncharacterized protein LOC113774008 [Coffea eugenioides]